MILDYGKIICHYKNYCSLYYPPGKRGEGGLCPPVGVYSKLCDKFSCNMEYMLLEYNVIN